MNQYFYVFTLDKMWGNPYVYQQSENTAVQSDIFYNMDDPSKHNIWNAPDIIRKQQG